MEISLNENKRKVLDNRISKQLKHSDGNAVGQRLLRKEIRHLKHAVEVIYTYLGYELAINVINTCKNSLEEYHNKKMGIPAVPHVEPLTSKPEDSNV